VRSADASPSHFNKLHAVAEKLDKDYIASLVSAARLAQTHPQFSREVAAFSAGWFRLRGGAKSTTNNIDSGDSRPAPSSSISKNPAGAPSAFNRMKEKSNGHESGWQPETWSAEFDQRRTVFKLTP
jgi:hypothetical protein